MKRGGGVHTVPAATGTDWWIKVDGRVASRHRLNAEAVIAGREIARTMCVEHAIHREDGQISEKNSYGADPCPLKDGR